MLNEYNIAPLKYPACISAMLAVACKMLLVIHTSPSHCGRLSPTVRERTRQKDSAKVAIHIPRCKLALALGVMKISLRYEESPFQQKQKDMTKTVSESCGAYPMRAGPGTGVIHRPLSHARRVPQAKLKRHYVFCYDKRQQN